MIRVITVSIASLAFLTGCLEDRVAVVESEMAKIRSKPAKEVSPPPVFEQVESFNYNASKLRSPFMPPTLSERLSEDSAAGSQVEPDLDRPTEQLEQFSLVELTMKGIMQDSAGELYALVEDPTGTLFPARVGNHMGKNHGRIVDISARQIELIEIVPDGAKGYVERPKTILAPES